MSSVDADQGGDSDDEVGNGDNLNTDNEVDDTQGVVSHVYLPSRRGKFFFIP